MDDEILWDLSMPGPLPQDAQIPIADYGQSNLGRFKHVYRRGLALRYGRAMQCIAGIHYNFSLPAAIWPLLAADVGVDKDAPDVATATAETVATSPNAAQAPDDVQSAGYMSMIRNYRRFSWLLLYLFGASPALDRSFFRDREDPSAKDKPYGLDTFGTDTLYLPYATSLRMSDLGYHNRASREMRRPDLSTLRTYLSGLSEAIAAPYAPYAEVGTHQHGEWVQLNTNLLQIENELYATIRPKRVGNANERIMHALARAGIEYVEVRCLDLDPFEDVGISDTTVRFLDAFLLMCVLEDSPCDATLQSEADANFLDVAKDGRRPDKTLVCNGTAITLAEWAEQLLARVDDAARILDSQKGDGVHVAAVHAQRAKLASPALLPSSRVWAATQAAGSYAAFGLARSRLHAELFRSEPLPAGQNERLVNLASASFATQQEREASDTMDFDTFVAQYGPL
jgi:glutamate--cysteine ligase